MSETNVTATDDGKGNPLGILTVGPNVLFRVTDYALFEAMRECLRRLVAAEYAGVGYDETGQGCIYCLVHTPLEDSAPEAMPPHAAACCILQGRALLGLEL